MPIGLVSPEEMEREIASYTRTPRVVPSVQIIDQDRPGRKDGDNNVPESLRKIIGEDAILNGRQSALELAKEFGISPASVSAYAVGATSTSTYQTPTKSISSFLTKSRQRAVKRASKTLNAAIGAITQEKLDYTDAKDLASIAKDMTVVIKNLEPPQVTEVSSGQNPPQFVIFSPQFRDERTFESIVINE